MSSYVISKRDYIRAAGLLAGIAEFYNRTYYDLWLYDYEHRRNMTTPDYHEQFTRLFELNAESVAWQYDDEAPETTATTLISSAICRSASATQCAVLCV